MTETEKAARIDELREIAGREWEVSMAASARHYDAYAEISRLQGNALEEEFEAALAACYRREPGAEERKDLAYARLQESRRAEGAQP